LKAELAKLKAMAGVSGEPVAHQEPSSDSPNGKDFVAEFEKVVINQEKLMTEDGGFKGSPFPVSLKND
jgi:hypothetical protein